MAKKQTLEEIHAEALKEFDTTQSSTKDERLQCLQDRRFYSIAGAQWEGNLGEQFLNKPRFEVNKVHLAVIRIINEYRNNRIGIDFVSKTGEEHDELAETCDGLHRADEQDSNAEEAYDNAFEEAVGGGMGAWMLHAEYEDDEDEENDHQRIEFKPIFDADSSVYFDQGAKRQDKADAKRCWVIRSMSHAAYKDEWADDVTSWPKDVHQTEFDWSTPDVVYVADYYVVEQGKDTLRVFGDLQGKETRYYDADFERDDGLEERLIATGHTETRTKKVKRRQVHKYIMSGGGVLEDCGIIPGKCIPVVPVYGKRWFVDNVERCMGHVRLAKDAQRLKNMQTSKLAEISALSSLEKPIFTPEQVLPHKAMWTNDPIEPYPYMLIDPITGPDGMQQVAGPVAYTKVPNIPPAMAALLQLTEQDIKDVLGNQQAGEQIQSNISGKVVELVQDKLDMQTYIYMSNMAKARKRSGEIWLSMQKDLYIEQGRKMKSIDSQGKAQMIQLLQPTIDKVTGDVVNSNDMSRADFDIVAEVGPSSSSKRQATVRSLTGMMQITQDPETLQVLASMVMLNMEGEGISDVRDYFRRKLVNMGVVKPTEEEQQKLQEQQANAKPDPNAQYLQAAAAEAEAKAAKARADTVLTIANAEKTQAQTVQIAAEIDDMEQQQAMQVIEKLGGNK